jgi:hypothetical protein
MDNVTDASNGNGAVYVSRGDSNPYSAVKVYRHADGTYTVRVINSGTV